MLVHTFFIRYIIATLAAIIFLTACSGGDDSIEKLPPLIKEVSFPFVTENALYAFDRKTGNNEKLAESNRSLMLQLDTDQSTKSRNENDEEVLLHTTLPEYVVYVVNQTIRLYDLNTRHDHLLLSFETTAASENRYVCDLQHMITLDEESLVDRVVLLKDEEAFYAKTSASGDCEGNAGSFEYYRISIEDSFTETYEVRRTNLLIHEHKHTHVHEHIDDHNHTHTSDIPKVADPEDPSGRSINNHEHRHVHQHDFIYKKLHAHEYIDDPDLVHNLPENQEIVTETHPVLVGKKHQITQAQMYSGEPIIDLDNKKFGYLGFNETDSAYKFYEDSSDPDDLNKYELWSMSNDEFLLQPENTYGKIQKGFNGTILLEFNWKVVIFPLEDLFDDDQDKEREYNVANPFFQRTQLDQYHSAVYDFDENTDTIAIQDLDRIFTIRNNRFLKHVRTLDNPGLVNIDFNLFNDRIVTIKEYEDTAELQSTAVTAISASNGQEQTLIPKNTALTLFRFFPNSTLTMSVEDTVNTTWHGFLINSNLTQNFSTPLENVTWGSVLDQRLTPSNVVNNREYMSAIIHADTAAESTINTRPVLVDPNVYLYDEDAIDGQGTLLGTIPTAITSVNDITIINELFGIIEVEESIPTTGTKYYYFNPDDASFEMKLMYQKTVNP